MSFTGAIRSAFIEFGIIDAASGKIAQIDQSMTKVTQDAAKSAEAVKKAGDSYRNVFLGLGAAAGVAGYGGYSYLRQGTEDLAKYQDAYAAFKANVKGNADDLVASLRTASAGLMDEGDMLGQANKALLMGLPEDKLNRMMLASRALSRATGEDLTSVYASLTSGTARQSPKMLEAIGIQMGAITEAEKAWAKANGTTYAALTEEQKSLIFTNYVLDHSDALLKKVNLSQESLSETLQKGDQAWKDLRQELAEGALPVISTVVNGFNWIVNALRALPGPAKGAIGIVAVLGTGMLILGSFTLLNAAAFMMLRKEMMAATETGSLWAATQSMLIGEEGLLATVTGGLTAAYTALAASELAVLWPLIPLVAILYLIWDIHSKGWKDSMLGRFIGWLGDTVPGLKDRFDGLVFALKVFWDWITKIPEAITGAWNAVINHPLFRIMGAALAFTPLGMAINSVQVANAVAPVVVPTADRIIASTSTKSIRTGDYYNTVKIDGITTQLDAKQTQDLIEKASNAGAKKGLALSKRDFERDVMASS